MKIFLIQKILLPPFFIIVLFTGAAVFAQEPVRYCDTPFAKQCNGNRVENCFDGKWTPGSDCSLFGRCVSEPTAHCEYSPGSSCVSCDYGGVSIAIGNTRCVGDEIVTCVRHQPPGEFVRCEVIRPVENCANKTPPQTCQGNQCVPKPSTSFPAPVPVPPPGPIPPPGGVPMPPQIDCTCDGLPKNQTRCRRGLPQAVERCAEILPGNCKIVTEECGFWRKCALSQPHRCISLFRSRRSGLSKSIGSTRSSRPNLNRENVYTKSPVIPDLQSIFRKMFFSNT